MNIEQPVRYGADDMDFIDEDTMEAGEFLFNDQWQPRNRQRNSFSGTDSGASCLDYCYESDTNDMAADDELDEVVGQPFRSDHLRSLDSGISDWTARPAVINANDRPASASCWPGDVHSAPLAAEEPSDEDSTPVSRKCRKRPLAEQRVGVEAKKRLCGGEEKNEHVDMDVW